VAQNALLRVAQHISAKIRDGTQISWYPPCTAAVHLLLLGERLKIRYFFIYKEETLEV